MEDYLTMMGATPESMRASARPAAQRQVRGGPGSRPPWPTPRASTISDEELEAELQEAWPRSTSMELDEVKRAIPVEDMKQDLRLRKAI